MRCFCVVFLFCFVLFVLCFCVVLCCVVLVSLALPRRCPGCLCFGAAPPEVTPPPPFGLSQPLRTNSFHDAALEARRSLLSPAERRRLGILTDAELSEEVVLPSVSALEEKGVDLAADFQRVDLVTMDYFVRRLPDGKLDFREVYAFEKGVDPIGLTREWWCALLCVALRRVARRSNAEELPPLFDWPVGCWWRARTGLKEPCGT